MGAITLVCFLSLTALATVLGLTVMSRLRPGDNLDPQVKTRLMETYRSAAEEAMGLSGSAFSMDLLIKIVPRNPIKAAADGDMLAVIFFTLVLGAALAALPGERSRPLLALLESLGHATVTIIHGVMFFGPVGVFCLIYSVTARFGFDLLLNLLKYVLAVVGSMAFMQFVGYALIVRFVAGRNPWEFLRKIRLVMITAFSTSSSNATLPTTMQVAQEELGISREVAGFVLPLGATLNMNGTALYEGATVLFLAQVFGVSLSLGQQLIVVLMSVVTAIGVAGIPGGSLPLLMMVLGMVGVPMEGIAIILGVDRILDMCRTVLNVTGDMVTAAIVTRVEGRRAGVSQ
jgi:DAACS family dicarboxylate/amino acid:cation (Na+ or H+) symporter